MTEDDPYDIWIGTIGVEGLASAVLSISEYGPMGSAVTSDILSDFP